MVDLAEVTKDIDCIYLVRDLRLSFSGTIIAFACLQRPYLKHIFGKTDHGRMRQALLAERTDFSMHK